MRVHRTKHTTGFTVLPNFCLRDRRLSFAARGLLSSLLSHPESIRQDIKTLAAGNPEGQEAIARAMRELITYGYPNRRLQVSPPAFPGPPPPNSLAVRSPSQNSTASTATSRYSMAGMRTISSILPEPRAPYTTRTAPA